MVSIEYLSRDQGALLLSASEDCTARLWTRDGQYIGMFGQVSKGQVFCIYAGDVRLHHKMLILIGSRRAHCHVIGEWSRGC